MHAFKIATRIDEDGEIRLSELPFRAGEEVEIIILPRQATVSSAKAPETPGEPLPPVTRRLLGIARGVNEEDYGRYREEKYR
jgi:hypothetical protein